MRIGFDAKRATMNFTGLGNYSRSLLINLGKFFPENRYILYTPRLKHVNRYPELRAGIPFQIITPPSFLAGFLGWFWRSFLVGILIHKDQIDLFHGLSGELPYGWKRAKISYLLTVHDLIFYRYPEFYKPIDRLLYRLKLRYAAKKADEIIAISQQTRNDLIQFLGLDPTKISVIYQGCHERFYLKSSTEKKQEIREKYKLPSRFILCVGTLEPRKRPLLLVKAYKCLLENERQYPDLEGVELVFVGKSTDYAEVLNAFINGNHLENQVHFRHDIPIDDLPTIYQIAELLAYPSTFEGFGLPILEALVSGLPVITSLGSCFQEAGGPDSLYLDPEDTTYFCAKLIEVLTNTDLKQEMRLRGWEYAENFEAIKITQTLMDRYKKLLK